MTLDIVLRKLLMLDGNESCELDKETYNQFKTLIIELMKMQYDIRYCSNDSCPCHPETRIKNLLEIKGLVDFLNREHLMTTIKGIVGKSNTNITVFDRYNLKYF